MSQGLKLSGNKCDPEPCENGAKCIRDNKRMDGYRCKCTSDFTGRNCQGNELNCQFALRNAPAGNHGSYIH